MKINNPKSLVGFTRTTQADNLAYNLATVSQVKAAISSLEKKFQNLLFGKNNRGQSSGNGYAWLNGEGKVDVSLMPAIAITDTYVISQEKLKDYINTDTTDNFTSMNNIINNALSRYLQATVNTENYTYQVGDIIIIKPTIDVAEDQHNIEPLYSGSYIITKVPDTEDEAFQFAKLADTDGTIVSINGVVSKNSAGHVHLSLKNILQERYYEIAVANKVESPTESANADAIKLEDSVYRIVTVKDSDGHYRFGFIDNSDEDLGSSVVPYARLDELNAIDEREADHYVTLTGAINELNTNVRADMNAADEAIRADMNTADEALSGNIDIVSGTIGSRSDIENANLSSTIFAQTKKLRSDVDNNYTEFSKAKNATDSMIRLVHKNTQNLHTGLEQRAVRLYFESFTWKADEGTATIFDMSSPDRIYSISNSDVIGSIKWKHVHHPSNQDVGKADQGASNVNSEERILGVYDENGNQVLTDLQRSTNIVTHLDDTIINVETEFIGYIGDSADQPTTEIDVNKTPKNSLAGHTWTLLIAKTISGIEFDSDLEKARQEGENL